jgi:predicted component of type VI protein secretion system
MSQGVKRTLQSRMSPCSEKQLIALSNTLPEPVTELLQTPGRHPELLYRELARLAGSLLTFSLEHTLAIFLLSARCTGAGIPAAAGTAR